MDIMISSIIICSILGLLIGVVIMALRENNEVGGYIAYSLSGIILGLCAGIIVGFFINVVTYSMVEPNEEYVAQYAHNIRGLQDSTAIEGSFVLGTGTVSEGMVYYFMREENGGWRMVELKASSILVREIENNDQPRLVREKEVFTNEKWHRLLMDSNETRDILYVPKNTISKEYTIDMK